MTLSRPSLDDYYMMMAKLAATRGTCARRQVGSVLTDETGRVVSVGYNGVPPKFPHCSEHPCGAQDFPSGEGLDKCFATHAEQSALLACSDLSRVATCYNWKCSPCFSCVKLLLQTSCRRVVFVEDYGDERARVLWEGAGREWSHLKPKTGFVRTRPIY